MNTGFPFESFDDWMNFVDAYAEATGNTQGAFIKDGDNFRVININTRGPLVPRVKPIQSSEIYNFAKGLGMKEEEAMEILRAKL